MSRPLALSVVIPALREGENLALLLPEVRETLRQFGVEHEILVVTQERDDATVRAVDAAGGRIILQRERGYGGALLAGFEHARGAFVLTMDADLSHPAAFIRTLWEHRADADVVIASRYVPGGRAEMPLGRYLLSVVLNRVFSRGLSLKVRDMSSGFRLFQAPVVRDRPFLARDFDVVQEVLVRAYVDGWRVTEVPFHYQPRRHGSSHARVIQFGMSYLRTFRSLWKLRNAVDCADYEGRAYDSAIPLQRYWQRRRYRHIVELIAGQGPVLDVGCGSSRVIQALPPGSIALDIRRPQLRYARRYGRALVQGSGCLLPFRDGTFACVLCAQTLGEVPKGAGLVDELCRVLRPGGRLVLDTPDYGQWEWRLIERAYRRIVSGAVRRPRARYTRSELVADLTARGFTLEASRQILRAETVLAFRKPA